MLLVPKVVRDVSVVRVLPDPSVKLINLPLQKKEKEEIITKRVREKTLKSHRVFQSGASI